MGEIPVEIRPGEFINFPIKGDKPNYVERKRIEKIVREADRVSTTGFTRKKDEQLFDYKTGIQDVKLRRKLSRAENVEEQALALPSMGLSELDYTRDMRGRLALTPSGAKKFGVDSDRNVMIDERGFTRADFADLSSLGREVLGGGVGAAIGQVAIPIPFLGAMIGAGLGTGTAKLAEETQEVFQGTSAQDTGEILIDTAKEAAIGALAEGAGQAVFKTIGSVFGKPGKNLTDDQLRLAGMSIDKFNIQPTLGQIGTFGPFARPQTIGEKVLGTSPRLRANHRAIVNQLSEFKGNYGASTPDEVAEVLVTAAKRGDKSVEDVRKRLSRDIIKTFKQSNESLGAAAVKDQTLDEDLFGIFKDSYKAFDDLMEEKFSTINKLVDDRAGNVAAFNITGLRKDAAEKLDQFVGVVEGNQKIAKNMLEGIVSLPNKASFSQLYRARKSINDTWLRNFGSSNVEGVKKDFLNRMDDLLGLDEVNRVLKNQSLRGLPAEKKAMYQAAAEEIPKARQAFAEGIKQFENLHGTLGLKNLVRSVKTDSSIDFAGAAKTLVKPNNPKYLKDAENALKASKIDFEPYKSRIASEWLRNAFSESTKANRTGVISTHKFLDQIEGLGTTGEELFGKNLTEIKKLANQMNALSLSNLSESMIDDVVAAGADRPAISLLRSLKDVAEEQAAANKSSALKALRDGTITATKAAEVIAEGSTKDVDVKKLIKYFNDPQDIDKIRSFYIDNIIGDFGDTFLTNPAQFKLFGQRLQKEFNTGKLEVVFGKEMAKDMNDFGEVLVFNSKAIEGGDLVAANIAAKPLENLGKIAKFLTFGFLFRSAPQYKSIVKQYKAMSQGASEKTKAQILGNLLANAFSSTLSQLPVQAIDEGVGEVKRQATAVASNVMQNATNKLQPPRPTTPVPQVLPPVSTPQTKSIEGRLPTIRQRARENPAVAATLLGGLGSAGLL